MRLLKNQNMTVTAVVTCHNYGQYLRQCLESVLSQSKPFDEIILVNDSPLTIRRISGRGIIKIRYAILKFKFAARRKRVMRLLPNRVLYFPNWKKKKVRSKRLKRDPSTEQTLTDGKTPLDSEGVDSHGGGHVDEGDDGNDT